MSATSRRRLLTAAAGGLALAGAAPLALDLLRRRDPGSPAPAPADPARPSPTGGDALTRGPLLRTSAPSRLTIPALALDAPVTGLDLAPDGSMQAPADAATVGWFTRAPTPGSLGPTVLAAHVDYRGRPGAFARLATLAAGDVIRVRRRDGVTAVFAVTSLGRYDKRRFPTAAVYGPIDHAGLRLITCGGDFDERAGHYRDNVVVYAELRAAETA